MGNLNLIPGAMLNVQKLTRKDARDSTHLPKVMSPALLPAPASLSAAAAITGGTLAAGAYRYRITALNASGESLASQSTTATVASGTTGSVVLNWYNDPNLTGITGFKLYWSAAGGAFNTELLLATLGTVVTYTDNGSVTPSGALPTTNTTGSQVIVSAPVATNPMTVGIRQLDITNSDWFSIFGAPVAKDGNGFVSPGSYYTSGKNSAGPFAFESMTDSTAFVIGMVGGNVTVMVDGQLLAPLPYATTPAVPSDGALYHSKYDLSALGSGKMRRITVFSTGKIFRVTSSALDTWEAPPARTGGVVIVYGDSIVEPTFVDKINTAGGTTISGSSVAGINYIGSAMLMNFLFPTFDFRPCGSGGTGYVNPGTGAPRVKATDAGRLAEVFSQNPTTIISCLGINDGGYGPATYSAIKTEVNSFISQTRAALPNCQIVFIGPYGPRGADKTSSGSLMARDAIEDAALAAGLPFGDQNDSILARGASRPTPGATVGAITAGNGTFVSTVSYPNGTILKVGHGSTDATPDVVLVASSVANGANFTVTLSGGSFGNGHPSGSVVRPYGPSHINGNENQATASPTTNSARITGFDNTHPTAYGHVVDALRKTAILTAILPVT